MSGEWLLLLADIFRRQNEKSVNVTDSARGILLSGAWTCQESFLDSWITLHVVKPFIKTSRFFFAFFFHISSLRDVTVSREI